MQCSEQCICQTSTGFVLAPKSDGVSFADATLKNDEALKNDEERSMIDEYVLDGAARR